RAPRSATAHMLSTEDSHAGGTLDDFFGLSALFFIGFERPAGQAVGALRGPPGARPQRHRQVLHGPRDRPGDGAPGGRLAGTPRARARGAASEADEGAQAPAR